MKRLFNNIISILYTFPKLCLLKIFHWNGLLFHPIERFSPNVDIYYIGHGTMQFGNKVRAHSGCKFRVIKNGIIKVDDSATFNYGCMLTAHEEIHIGAGVEFGPNVLIYDHDHDFRAVGGLKANKFKTGKVQIGEKSWIGANTVILKNTTIGKNCVVGAGCVLTNCTIPDNSIVVQRRGTEIKSYKLNK